MKNSGLTLIEVLVVIVILVVLGALLLPALTEAIRASKITQCTSNLKQIGTLAEVYRKTFGGDDRLLPTERGEAWLLKLIDTVSENKDNSVFRCPLGESESTTGTDYRGPALDVNKDYSRTTLPIVADKCPGGKTQHLGNNTKLGIYGLTRGYQVMSVYDTDARWADFGPDSPYLKE